MRRKMFAMPKPSSISAWDCLLPVSVNSAGVNQDVGVAVFPGENSLRVRFPI